MLQTSGVTDSASPTTPISHCLKAAYVSCGQTGRLLPHVVPGPLVAPHIQTPGGTTGCVPAKTALCDISVQFSVETQ